MKNNSKKSNKLSFEYIYNPYQLEKNVDFSSIFQCYLNDNNSIIDINGVTFYHALQIIQTNIKVDSLIVALDNRMNLKTQDIVINEHEQQYLVTGFETFRFAGEIPKWYSKINFVILIGNTKNIGKYYATLK